MKQFQNYIGGEWVDAASGDTFDSTSPADGELIGTFPKSSAEDVDRAVEAAKEAFEDWRLVPAPRRGEILFGFAQLLHEHKAELTDLMTHEMGKVKAEAGGDVQEAIDMSYYMGGEGRRLFGQTTPSELPDKFNMSVRMPIGVIGVITPWNFPIAIPSWKIAPALVAGNTVVFKPATDTPALGQRFVELLDEAGVPKGVVNIVHGGGGAVGDRLVKHPDVPRDHAHRLARDRRHGDEECRRSPQAHPSRARRQERDHRDGGRRSRSCARRDPLVRVRHVWPALHRDEPRHRPREPLRRARRAAGGAGGGASPRAWLGGRHRRRPGDQRYRAREDPLVHADRDRRRREAPHRRRDRERWRARRRASTIAPRSSGTSRPDMRIAQEEIFGPTLSLIRVRDEAEAVRVSNGIRYGLSSSIFTRDVNRAFRAMRDLEAGITYINAGTIGAEVHLPFGGTKDTGNGHREAGQAALDVFTEWKSVYVDYSGTFSARRSTTSERQGQSGGEARDLRRAVPAEDRRLLQRQQGHGRRRSMASSSGTRIPIPTTSSSSSPVG